LPRFDWSHLGDTSIGIEVDLKSPALPPRKSDEYSRAAAILQKAAI
jgi:hypothetical protein